MSKKWFRVLTVMGVVALCLSAVTTATAADEAEVMEKLMDDSTLRAYWKNGIRLDSNDGSVKLKLGGRIMSDFAFYDADSELPEFTDGAEFRRARLYLSGTVYEQVEFKAQYDFAGGDADFKDVYIGLNKLPFGGIRVGHFKEPFSLEELTSSKYITFMERSLPNAFSPGRNHGLMVHGAAAEGLVTWAVGAFRDADDFGDSVDDTFDLTARVTGLPWNASKSQFAHLGLSYRYTSIDNLLRYRERPESHIAPRLVDTKVEVMGDEGEMESQSGFEADSENVLGLEAAAVFGPASVQGEYIMTSVDSPQWGDPEFNGYYLYGSYFLTGESRAYKASSGSFDRVKPAQNFLGEEGGMGAWELAARYSTIDIGDAQVDGGELSDFTLGVNWYMNPNTRMMFNYVNADVDGSGSADILQARFQIDF